MRGLHAALLILVVSARRPVAHLLAIVTRDPAIQRAFKRVRFRRHQSRRPQHWIRPTRPHCIAEELFASARQDDSFTMSYIFLLRIARKFKIHQPIVADISQKSRTAMCRQV